MGTPAAVAMTARGPAPVAAPAATGMVLALSRNPEISSAARAAVRAFTDRLGEQHTADACLLVSELVSNAYRHGHGQIRLTIALHNHVARFSVHDDGDATLQPSTDPGEHGGFGLNIVARVSDRWGTSPTHVWFELHTPSRPSPPHDTPFRDAGACRRR